MPRDWRMLAVIAAGGALGALGRFGLTSAFPVRPGGYDWVVFGINVSGSFALGVAVTVLSASRSAHPLLRPFLGTGVLGGFTTFSSYAVGIQNDLAHGEPRTALLYGTATVITALGAAWAGVAVARIRRPRDDRETSETASRAVAP